MSPPYRPQSYWSERLSDGFDLRATGHVEYSAGYNEWLYRAKRRALRRCLRDVPAGADALDVGSGVGWVVAQLEDHGLAVEGCDIAPLAVEELSRRFPTASFFQLALGSDAIPRPDGSYDLVTALDVTYHITDDDTWLAGMSELARVLRPGAMLVISDGLGAVDRTPAAHVRFRSRETWNRVRSLGLEIADVAPYYRWLSRPRAVRGFRHLGDRPRGAVEYALERLAPREAHMRCAVLVKRPDAA